MRHPRSHQLHRNSLPLVVGVLALACLSTAARAYVDLAPTLAKIVNDSKQIAVVEVEQYNPRDHTVTLKPARPLKGDLVAGPVRHLVTAAEGAPVPRQIQQWAAPGARGVLFASARTSLVCIGESWYPVRLNGTTWRLGPDRPDLPLAYCGTVSRLSDAIELMLAGKDAVITMVPHGGDGEAASFDLALNRFNIPGLVKVQRMRVNLKMGGPVMATSANPAFVLGQGPVDEADLPALIEKLASPDATVRREAAEDVRSLGRRAAEAAPALTKGLDDPTPRVRLAAASALVRVNPKGAKDSRALEVLSQGLAANDPAVRRDAAKATGLAGRAAGALTDKLITLLNDKDEAVRVAALQGVSTLGPAATGAAAAVKPLLDNPDLMLDAADALGRMGPAARPVPPQLAKMLSSPQTPVQWAAVRAMSQIGGPEAHPAVEYMMKALPRASEVDGYNMMIYFSLLGPDAKDAEETIRNNRIKNPVLPSATLLALAPEKYLPWQGGGRGFFGGRGGFGGPGGPGGRGGRGEFDGPPGGPRGGIGGPDGPGRGPGGPGGPGGGLDLFSTMYEAYVDELGTRLRPVAPVVARKIMDGTAGNVPDYGYKLLACGPEEALAVLTPHLADGDVNLRERAAAAIGHMGPAGAGAKEKLTAAMNKAPTEQEKRLVQWALRKIEEE